MVIIEYEVHGKIIRTGASYDNRFISVVPIEDRNRKVIALNKILGDAGVKLAAKAAKDQR